MTTLLCDKPNGAMPFSELGRVFQKLLHPMTTLLRERKNGAMPRRVLQIGG